MAGGKSGGYRNVGINLTIKQNGVTQTFKDINKGISDVVIQNKKMSESIKKSSQDFTKFGSNATKSLRGINKTCSQVATTIKGAVATAIAMASNKILNMGVSLTSTINRTNAVFKDGSYEIRAWANELQRVYGFDPASLMSNAATYQALITAFGVGADQAKNMSMNLSKLAEDYAIYLGLPVDDVADAFRSGIIGQTESIQKLGIQIEQTMLKQIASQLGIKKQVKDMNDVELATMRYIAIMYQAQNANGYFADTMDSSVNRLQVFKNTWVSIGKTVGAILLELFNKMSTFLIGISLAIEKMFSGIAGFMGIDLGKQAEKGASSTKDTNKALDTTNKKLDDTDKKAKKARNSLASFDELVTVPKADTGDDLTGGVGQDNIFAGVDFSLLKGDAETWLTQLREQIDETFKKGIKLPIDFGFTFDTSALKNELNTLMQLMKGITGQLDFSNILSGLSELGISTLQYFTTLGLMLGEVLIGGVNNFLSDRGNDIVVKFNEYLNNFRGFISGLTEIVQTSTEILNMIDLEPLKGIVGDTLSVFWDIGSTVSLIASDIATRFVDGIATFMYVNKERIATTINGVVEIFSKVANIISTIVNDICTKAKSAYDTYIGPSITSIMESLTVMSAVFMEVWNKEIQPVLVSLCDKFLEVYEEYISPIVGRLLETIGKLAQGFTTIWNETLAPFITFMVVNFSPIFKDLGDLIGDVMDTVGRLFRDTFNGVFDVLDNLIEFIVNIFTLKWGDAWGNIKGIFKGIFDSLVGIVKTPLNLIIDIVNMTIRGINKFKIDIPDWIRDIPGMGWIGESFGFNIPQIPKLATGGVVDSATIAMIGEAGKEAVLPLDNNTGWMSDLAYILAQQLRQSDGGGKGDVHIHVNADNFVTNESAMRELARHIKGYIDDFGNNYVMS